MLQLLTKLASHPNSLENSCEVSLPTRRGLVRYDVTGKSQADYDTSEMKEVKMVKGWI